MASLCWRLILRIFKRGLIIFGRTHASPNSIIPSTRICLFDFPFENIFNFEGRTCTNFKHGDIKRKECQNKWKLIISSSCNNTREKTESQMPEAPRIAVNCWQYATDADIKDCLIDLDGAVIGTFEYWCWGWATDNFLALEYQMAFMVVCLLLGFRTGGIA